MVNLGLHKLLDGKTSLVGKARLGLLSNQASTGVDLVHTRHHLQNVYPGQLTCLFSPQHGFFAEKQDNMIESDHAVDPETGLKVFSLYGESRKPSEEMFDLLDILLIDIVDVGTRVYTFMYTMGYCLELAARMGKKVVVLDRPNPLGGAQVEGNILELEYSSFVGLYPLPMRHGMTFGELALYINREQRIDCDLEVVKMDGWRREMYFRDTGVPWIYPSPNMPAPETTVVYPGQVIWEGTTVSEGRGTTLPFELVGAPYWQPELLLKELKKIDLPGCFFRPISFEPTSGKHMEEVCNGFHLHVTDNRTFKPYKTSLALLRVILEVHREEFAYKQPPYEYEYHKLPMDLILGSQDVRKDIESGKNMDEIEQGWQQELHEFLTIRENYLLYS